MQTSGVAQIRGFLYLQFSLQTLMSAKTCIIRQKMMELPAKLIVARFLRAVSFFGRAFLQSVVAIPSSELGQIPDDRKGG